MIVRVRVMVMVRVRANVRVKVGVRVPPPPRLSTGACSGAPLSRCLKLVLVPVQVGVGAYKWCLSRCNPAATEGGKSVFRRHYMNR